MVTYSLLMTAWIVDLWLMVLPYLSKKKRYLAILKKIFASLIVARQIEMVNHRVCILFNQLSYTVIKNEKMDIVDNKLIQVPTCIHCHQLVIASQHKSIKTSINITWPGSTIVVAPAGVLGITTSDNAPLMALNGGVSYL